MPNLLIGVRVIESSMLLNGASTSMLLADLGAEVIKVESPFMGDYIRLPYTRHLNYQVNRNKRSVALDLTKDRAREIFARLVATADVFVTNAVGRRNEKLGLSYAQLSALKPDLIYCQNTGFGAEGPYSDLPVHGQMMDSLAGSLPVEMGPDGLTRPSMPVTGRGGSMMMGGEGTAASAVYAALNIAAALHRRSVTGEGCYIDVSAAEAVVASAWTSACTLLNAPAERRGSLSRPEVARYQFYEAADGRFLLFCPEETKFWHSFCDVVGRPDLKDRESGLDLRLELQSIFRGRDRDSWMQLARSYGWPLGPANNSIDEVRADPHMQARGVFREGVSPDGSVFVYVEGPAHVAGQERAAIRPAPNLGEHTSEILGELGYSREEISDLFDQRITSSATRREAIPNGLAEVEADITRDAGGEK